VPFESYFHGSRNLETDLREGIYPGQDTIGFGALEKPAVFLTTSYDEAQGYGPDVLLVTLPSGFISGEERGKDAYWVWTERRIPPKYLSIAKRGTRLRNPFMKLLKPH
jgi:hypothetical protein